MGTLKLKEYEIDDLRTVIFSRILSLYRDDTQDEMSSNRAILAQKILLKLSKDVVIVQDDMVISIKYHLKDYIASINDREYKDYSEIDKHNWNGIKEKDNIAFIDWQKKYAKEEEKKIVALLERLEKQKIDRITSDFSATFEGPQGELIVILAGLLGFGLMVLFVSIIST